MKFYKEIRCCEHFNYSKPYDNIKDTIMLDCFLWDESEDIDFSIVSNYLLSSNYFSHLYFFTTKTCDYPLNFIDKKMGLWKNLRKTKSIDYINSYENGLSLDRFFFYYGGCEISTIYLENALNIMHNDFLHSYILFSNDVIDLKLLFDKNFTVVKNSYVQLNFDILVNKNAKNKIVTSIVGYDGTSINCFYSKNSNDKC